MTTQMIGIYDSTTKEFVRVATYNDAAELAAIVATVQTGFSYVTAPFIDIDIDYAPSGVVTGQTILEENEISIIADGGATSDGKVDFAIPNGTVVYSYFHQTTTTSSGTSNFTFQSLRPGVYNFDLTPPAGYVPLKLEITVNAV